MVVTVPGMDDKYCCYVLEIGVSVFGMHRYNVVWNCHVSAVVSRKFCGEVAVVLSECSQSMTHLKLGHHRSPLECKHNLLRYLMGHAVDDLLSWQFLCNYSVTY